MIRIGTRGSTLALAQAGLVAAGLGADTELVPMRTEGDRLAEARLAAVGGKGLFVREIEEALLRREIDVAVHSLKDLPAEPPAGLVLAAFLPREDPRDVLVGKRPVSLEGLAAGAVIGTSSPRRRALVLAIRPDLGIEPIRGNVDTRLRKLAAGGFDAIVLAAAGLRRLGLAPAHCTPLDPERFVPAVGQGIIAVEARDDDTATLARLTRLDHAATRACALAERAYLALLGASCTTPVAAHARLEGATLQMSAIVADEEGRRLLRTSGSGPAADAASLGRGLAEELLAKGAATITELHPLQVERSHEPSSSGHPRVAPDTGGRYQRR
ncbi:MAG TPA: hydroxymethylbilane synthase [Methylomirabilota bacterium]|nr:hydroxymethylbilane synthase [Methylomirabilota bacterium]